MYEGSIEKFGIKGARYTVTEQSLDNGTYNGDQACYAIENSAEWLPHGLRNASACRWGAPAYFSLPHLLMADEQLMDFLEPGTKLLGSDHKLLDLLQPFVILSK